MRRNLARYLPIVPQPLAGNFVLGRAFPSLTCWSIAMRSHWVVLSIASAMATSAFAEEPLTNLGVLTCTLAESRGQQSGNMTCGFKASGSRVEEKYLARVVGLSQPGVGRLVLVWTVMGPSGAKPTPGALAQRYLRAEAAGEPPSLVGETTKAIVLQFETHDRAETGSGIAEVELRLTGTSA